VIRPVVDDISELQLLLTLVVAAVFSTHVIDVLALRRRLFEEIQLLEFYSIFCDSFRALFRPGLYSVSW